MDSGAGRIGGIGPQAHHKAPQGEANAKEGVLKFSGFSGKATVNDNSQSLATQASLLAPPPQQAAPKALDTRLKSASSHDSDKDSGEVEDKDDKKSKDKKKAQKRAITRVSDVDKKRGRQQQQGFMATLERQAKMRKIRDIQEMVELAWKGDGSDEFSGFSDITEVYDGIRAAQSHFAEHGDSDLQYLAGTSFTAANVLLDEQGPDIRAGWLVGTGPEAADELQSYRQNVLRYKSVPETFSAIAEKTGGDLKLFNRDIEKLLKTIQQDLASGETSMEPAHLKEINNELFQVQITGQTLKDVTFLYRDMNQTHQLDPPLPQASIEEYDIVTHDPQNLGTDYYSSSSTDDSTGE